MTSDPGILFVVLNINDRTKERVFWKYISNSFLNSIDSTKDSCLIKFTPEDEIFERRPEDLLPHDCRPCLGIVPGRHRGDKISCKPLHKHAIADIVHKIKQKIEHKQGHKNPCRRFPVLFTALQFYNRTPRLS